MANHTILDAKEASEIVFQGKVGPNKLLQMGKSNQIPMIKVGVRYFFSLDDLQSFISTGLVKSNFASEDGSSETKRISA